jgi:5-methylcytosine-specific restriction endonuclease McrA
MWKNLNLISNPRTRQKFQQRKINTKLKKKLFGHLSISNCCYCKYVWLVKDLTIEHIIPLSNNGSNEKDNIALACRSCNQNRGKISWRQKKLQVSLKI